MVVAQKTTNFANTIIENQDEDEKNIKRHTLLRA